MDFRRWQIFPKFTMTDGFVTLNITWEPMPYEDGVNRNGLYVGEFNGVLPIPGEAPKMYFYKPERLKVTKYEPDLSRALEYGWKVVKSEEFISTPALASNCAIRFLDLVEKRKNGGIKPLGR